MRLTIVLALALVLGGIGLAAAPAATACSSDPDSVCIVIGKVECSQGMKPAAALEECWGVDP
jgi:hypothetical protein